MTKDYVPGNDAAFDNWFNNINSYTADKTMGQSPAWPNIPQGDVAAMARAYSDWRDGYEPTLHPHTPAQTAAKNVARRQAEAVIRPFVQRFLHWPPVGDDDRINMGIPNRDRIRTDHHEVTEVVEFEVKLRNIRELLVGFWVKSSPNKAKPAGYDGAVVVWDLLDAPPSGPEALKRHTMASRTPHALEFAESERGKTAYVALAWQNERGRLGAFSEIQSAVVP